MILEAVDGLSLALRQYIWACLEFVVIFSHTLIQMSAHLLV